MLSEGGKLSPYLSSIAGITDQIAAGNTRRLYQAMNGQAVGLYDREEHTFWFITRDEAAQEGLENLLGFSAEDGNIPACSCGTDAGIFRGEGTA